MKVTAQDIINEKIEARIKKHGDREKAEAEIMRGAKKHPEMYERLAYARNLVTVGGHLWEKLGLPKRVYFNGAGPNADFWYSVEDGEWHSTNKKTRPNTIKKFVESLDI